MRRLGIILAAAGAAVCMTVSGCGKTSYREALRSGTEAVEQGETEQAREWFEQAISGKSGNRYQRTDQKALRYLGIFAYEDGDYEKAAELLEEAAGLHGDTQVLTDILCYLGDCYEKLGREKEAADTYARVLEREENASVKNRRLYLLWKLGEMKEEEVLSAWEEAAQKGDAQAWIYAGRLYQEKEDYKAALAAYEAGLKESEQKSAGLYQAMAYCRRQTGEPEQALELLEAGEAVAGEEEKKELLWEQVALLEELGRYAEAYGKAGEYLELFPDDETMRKEQLFLQTRCD